MSRSRRSIGVALAGGIALLASCASTPDEQLTELPTAEELYAEGQQLMEEGTRFLGLDMTDYERAIDRFQDVIDNYPYSEYAVRSELRIADAYFEQNRWDEALSYYREFAELHPEHEKVPYTIYRTALCHEEQSKQPNRDQTATRDALAALDRLISRYPESAEAVAAKSNWEMLRTKLARHELMIADFYLDRTEFQSAANRYRAVLNEYPGLGFDAEALYKLGFCYRHMNRDEEAHELFEVILQNYPGSDIAAAAQDLIPSAN